MITIKCFVFGPVAVNCYVVSDRATGEGAVVDCGAFGENEFRQLEQYVSENGIKLKRSLQTHMHFDHVFGLGRLFSRYGLRPVCHPEEARIYQGNTQLAMELCGVSLPLPEVEMDYSLSGGQTVRLGETELTVLHTPGHTPGSLCFHFAADGVLLSGDTLFRGSIGRTDTPLGNWRTEVKSVKTKLLTLPPDTVVHPGHGPSTTISQELRFNPYVS